MYFHKFSLSFQLFLIIVLLLKIIINLFIHLNLFDLFLIIRFILSL